MNLRVFQILFILWCSRSGRMEEQEEKMADDIPQQIFRTEVKGAKEKGIDVSNWQKKIDWNSVAKSGVKHAFIKMSEGKNYKDPYFVDNWTGAQKAGINVNCYHYFRAPTTSPKDQLKNIKSNLKLVKFNASKNALAIDVELTGNENATPTQMADNLNALLTLIKKDSKLSQLPLMIYTSYGFWNSKVNWKKHDFSVYGLWVAHWYTDAPRLPEPWKGKGKKWVWWQYSAKGKIDGIQGDVDLDWVSV